MQPQEVTLVTLKLSLLARQDFIISLRVQFWGGLLRRPLTRSKTGSGR
jgi:hypothetical protein